MGGFRARLALAAALLLLPLAGPAFADTVSDAPGGSVVPFHAALVPFHGKVHVLGGFVGNVQTQDAIRVYDPDAGTWTTTASHLPRPAAFLHAVWDPRARPAAGCPDGCAYVFGLWNATSGLNEIYQYDPASQTGHVAQTFDTGGVSLGVDAPVLVGSQVVLPGGVSWSCATPGNACDSIYVYDVDANAIRLSATRLPEPLLGLAGAAVGDAAYLFGGGGCGPEACDTILRFDPATDALALLPTRLPGGLYDIQAFSDGHHAFLLGGELSGIGPQRDVLRFDPAGGALVPMSQRLPAPAPEGQPTVWTGRAALVLQGGRAPLRYTLEPGAPGNLTVLPAPPAAALALSWSAPAANTYSLLTEYRVYRLDLVGGARTLVARVDASQTTAQVPLVAGAFAYQVAGVNDGVSEGRLTAPVALGNVGLAAPSSG